MGVAEEALTLTRVMIANRTISSETMMKNFSLKDRSRYCIWFRPVPWTDSPHLEWFQWERPLQSLAWDWSVFCEVFAQTHRPRWCLDQRPRSKLASIFAPEKKSARAPSSNTLTRHAQHTHPFSYFLNKKSFWLLYTFIDLIPDLSISKFGSNFVFHVIPCRIVQYTLVTAIGQLLPNSYYHRTMKATWLSLYLSLVPPGRVRTYYVVYTVLSMTVVITKIQECLFPKNQSMNLWIL